MILCGMMPQRILGNASSKTLRAASGKDLTKEHEEHKRRDTRTTKVALTVQLNVARKIVNSKLETLTTSCKSIRSA